jgi:hypothetical protein
MKLIMESWRGYLEEEDEDEPSSDRDKVYKLFNYTSAEYGIMMAETTGDDELVEKFQTIHHAIKEFIKLGEEYIADPPSGEEKWRARSLVRKAYWDLTTPKGGELFQLAWEVRSGGTMKPTGGEGWAGDLDQAVRWATDPRSGVDKNFEIGWDSLKEWAGV